MIQISGTKRNRGFCGTARYQLACEIGRTAAMQGKLIGELMEKAGLDVTDDELRMWALRSWRSVMKLKKRLRRQGVQK